MRAVVIPSVRLGAATGARVLFEVYRDTSRCKYKRIARGTHQDIPSGEEWGYLNLQDRPGTEAAVREAFPGVTDLRWGRDDGIDDGTEIFVKSLGREGYLWGTIPNVQDIIREYNLKAAAFRELTYDTESSLNKAAAIRSVVVLVFGVDLQSPSDTASSEVAEVTINFAVTLDGAQASGVNETTYGTGTIDVEPIFVYGEQPHTWPEAGYLDGDVVMTHFANAAQRFMRGEASCIPTRTQKQQYDTYTRCGLKPLKALGLVYGPRPLAQCVRRRKP